MRRCPLAPGRGLVRSSRGRGTVGSEWAAQVHGPWSIGAGVSSMVGSGGNPSLGIREREKVARSGETESRQWTGKPLLSLVAGRVSEAPQAECVSVWAGAGGGRACGRPLSGKVGRELAGPGGLAMAQPRFAVAPGPAKRSGECVRSRGPEGCWGVPRVPGQEAGSSGPELLQDPGRFCAP